MQVEAQADLDVAGRVLVVVQVAQDVVVTLAVGQVDRDAVVMPVVGRADQDAAAMRDVGRKVDVDRAVVMRVADLPALPKGTVLTAAVEMIADAAKEKTKVAGMAVETHGVMARAKVARRHIAVPHEDTARAARHSSRLAAEVDAPRSARLDARHLADVPRLVADLRSAAGSPPSVAGRPSDLAPRPADSARAAPVTAGRASAKVARLAKRLQRRYVRDSPR